MEIGESLLVDARNGLEEFSDVLDRDTLQAIKVARERLAEALDGEDEDKVSVSIDHMLRLWDEVEESLEDEDDED